MDLFVAPMFPVPGARRAPKVPRTRVLVRLVITTWPLSLGTKALPTREPVPPHILPVTRSFQNISRFGEKEIG